ncbi:hypothetical protein B0H10DRAFT_2101133 [Mycena sp. CBHHK59/15]|nr:hypothetical protein B0H10DRAFT_2101133 [Mycena sp. CBHHK59/15]
MVRWIGHATGNCRQGPSNFFCALSLSNNNIYGDMHLQVGKSLEEKARTTASSAFWMTFVSLIFLLLASCIVRFGHRKQRANVSPSYPMSSFSGHGIFARFCKN